MSLFGNMPDEVRTPDLNFGSPLMSLAAMVAQPYANQLFNRAGFVPGQLFGARNYFDQMQGRDYFAQRDVAVGMGTQVDRENYARTIRGVLRMGGMDTPRHEQLAQTMAGGIAAAAPLLMQFMPEEFDQLHGSRGSAGLLAMGMHRGGRFAVDPVTGLSGMSGTSAGRMAAQFQQQFFGPGADITAFKGLSMGRLGLMYEDLAGRGALPSSIANMGEGAQLDAIAGDRDFTRSRLADVQSRLTGEQRRGLGPDFDRAVAGDLSVARNAMAEIQRNAPEEWSNIKRDFDSKKVGDRMKDLSGAVKAMGEIFGDAGRPNAPMKELIAHVEKFTQGGLATMSGPRLEQSVRMTQAIAQSSGVGIEGMMALMATGANITDHLGIEREFAVSAAQHAAGFGRAFGQSGGAERHFQRGSPDQMAAMDLRLTAQAAESGAANQLGMAARLVAGGGMGAPLTAMYEAAKAHQRTFVNPLTGREESTLMSSEAFNRLAAASGADAGYVNAMRGQTDTNREYIARDRFDVFVRQEGQPADVKKMVAQSHRSAIRRLLGDRGDAEQLALGAGQAAAEALVGMDPAVLADNEKRDALVGTAIRQRLGAAANNLSDRQLSQAAGLGFGDWDSAARGRGFGSGMQGIDAVSDRTLAQQKKQAEADRATARMRSATAPLAKELGARIIDAVQKPQEGLGSFVAEVLGGQRPEDIRAVLGAGDAGDLNDNQRASLMTEAVAEALRAAEKAKTIEDPVEREKAIAAAEGDVQAYVKGGGKAQAEVDRLRVQRDTVGLGEGDARRLAAMEAAVPAGLAETSGRKGVVADTPLGGTPTEQMLGGLRNDFFNQVPGMTAAGDVVADDEKFMTMEQRQEKRKKEAVEKMGGDRPSIFAEAMADAGKTDAKEAAKGAPGAVAGGNGTLQLTGRVTIEGNGLNFSDVRAVPAAGAGSTPLMLMPT